MCTFSLLVIFRLGIIIWQWLEVREKKIGFLLFPEHYSILRVLWARKLGGVKGTSFGVFTQPGERK